MKIKCVKAKTDPSSGLFGLGAHDGEEIEGLTLGKTYTAQVVNELSGGGSMRVSNDFQFLIFNDKGEWEVYDLYLFVPAE